MSKAIITLTRGGMTLGLSLHHAMGDTILYVNEKFEVEGNDIKKIHKNLTAFMGEIFSQYECLIFIMATGIVVRAIAPYIRDKKTDPAVIVLDEKGKNVISLLSGHIGGANEWTLQIAELLGGNPVITTASDVNESIAVDTLAMKLNCLIENYRDATRVTAHIVNGESVGLLSHIPVDMDLPQNITLMESENIPHEKFAGVIYITEKKIENDLYCDQVILRPKNIILGIGCKKGKTKEEILYAIQDTLNSLDISQKSLKHIATVDIKQNEIGLIEAAQALEIPLVIISRDRIREIETDFEASDFVKRTIGVGAVCEPAAMLSSEGGMWLQRKKTYGGITIAVIREGGIGYGNHCSGN